MLNGVCGSAYSSIDVRPCRLIWYALIGVLRHGLGWKRKSLFSVMAQLHKCQHRLHRLTGFAQLERPAGLIASSASTQSLIGYSLVRAVCPQAFEDTASSPEQLTERGLNRTRPPPPV